MNRTVEQARLAAESAQQWAGSVGGALRRSEAAKWLEAGLKIGALRTGARVVGGFARRHPAVAIATVAGAGLLCYAAYRRRQRARADGAGSDTAREHAPGRQALEGQAPAGQVLDGQALEGRARQVPASRAGARPAVTPGAD